MREGVGRQQGYELQQPWVTAISDGLVFKHGSRGEGKLAFSLHGQRMILGTELLS